MALTGGAVALRASRSPSLIQRLLSRRGMTMVSGRAAGILAELHVQDAMVSDHATILESASLAEIQRQAMVSPYNVLAVVDGDNGFRGLLTLDRLPNHADLKGISSRDLLDEDAITVGPQSALEEAYVFFTKAPALAVVDEKDRLVGLLFKSQVDARYHREVGRRALGYYASQTFK
jgi:CBS domain-containing protein